MVIYVECKCKLAIKRCAIIILLNLSNFRIYDLLLPEDLSRSLGTGFMRDYYCLFHWWKMP